MWCLPGFGFCPGSTGVCVVVSITYVLLQSCAACFGAVRGVGCCVLLSFLSSSWHLVLLAGPFIFVHHFCAVGGCSGFTTMTRIDFPFSCVHLSHNVLQRDAIVGIGVTAQATAGNPKRHTPRRRAGPQARTNNTKQKHTNKAQSSWKWQEAPNAHWGSGNKATHSAQ